jgi:metal-responsive CopG/Arc/MetJ family transcriptional regulator
MPRLRKAPARDVTVYLSVDLFDKVDKVSGKMQIPRSHFVEQVLAEYFKQNDCNL